MGIWRGASRNSTHETLRARFLARRNAAEHRNDVAWCRLQDGLALDFEFPAAHAVRCVPVKLGCRVLSSISTTRDLP